MHWYRINEALPPAGYDVVFLTEKDDGSIDNAFVGAFIELDSGFTPVFRSRGGSLWRHTVCCWAYFPNQTESA